MLKTVKSLRIYIVVSKTSIASQGIWSLDSILFICYRKKRRREHFAIPIRPLSYKQLIPNALVFIVFFLGITSFLCVCHSGNFCFIKWAGILEAAITLLLVKDGHTFKMSCVFLVPLNRDNYGVRTDRKSTIKFAVDCERLRKTKEMPSQKSLSLCNSDVIKSY